MNWRSFQKRMDPRTWAQECYGVISVIPWVPLYSVKFVTFICVKPVFGNICLMNPQNTKRCHIESGDLILNVQNIPHTYMIFTVNNVTLHFVWSVSPLVYILDTNRIVFWKILNTKKESLQKDLQDLENYLSKIPTNCI